MNTETDERAHEPASKIAKYDFSDNIGNSTSTDCEKSGDHKPEVVIVIPGGSPQQLSVDVVDVDAVSQKLNKAASYLNTYLFSTKIQTELQKCYKDSNDFCDGTSGMQLYCSPFHHCILPNFVTDSDYIADLESALLDLPLKEKNNDLYKFRQSNDLNHSKSQALTLFRSLCDDIKVFLSHVTEIPLNSKIDLFCSHYRYTDVLLCHDDELEARRIAFIYYLVPESWSLDDGGTLDLFDTDEHGQPKNIVKSIVPKRNSFLFFEVSAASFHQVAEVLSENMTRLSISGWFHGPPLPRPAAYVDTLPPAVQYGSVEEEVFYAWINPFYLAPEIQADIKKQFEEDSEIELTDFLQGDKYAALVEALADENIKWSLLGPANKRKYYSADMKQMPQVVSEFLHVIHSDAAFLVLSNLTGLKLHPLAPCEDSEVTVNGKVGGPSSSSSSSSMVRHVTADPRCRSEVRRWEHSCYTLGHDTDTEMQDFALDTVMYIGCTQEWLVENGGYTSYIAKGEEEELLSVCPASNCLALVYRDKDTMRFVKHLNHRVTKLSPPRFFDISTVYYE
ncbi:unnamed protein product [Candidula unifasciata]|uniref:Prolyl 4-hydroxylase alpha subunit domain-containing protein n=1 Tax=Candidula unifasciata TaxID=100452 RepID=A0A8S3YDI7_9EUPU|nr:unnamed protein product [Candidula unifasciata]